MSLTVPVAEIVRANRNALLGAHESWERVLLADVATVQNGFAFPSSLFSKAEGIPLIRIRDVLRTCTEATFTGPYDPAYLVEPGELLVGMDGDFNAALWKEPSGLLNQRVCRITPDERSYDRRFLAYVLPGYLTAINAETSSITVKHLSSRSVQEIPLPLPPISEQRRIVAEIETQFTRLDAAVAALERARANLTRYRAAVLAEAVERPREAHYPAWTCDSLASLVTRSEYGTSVKCSHDATNEPVLRIPNVVRGRIDVTDVKFASKPLGLREDLALQPGDLLMVRTNGRIDLVGRSAVIPHPMSPPHGFASYLLRFRFDHRRVLPEWVHVYLSSPRGREFIERHAASSAGQHNVSLSMLGNMPVPLPSVEEQQVIVGEVDRRLSIIEDMEATIDANLKRTERFRQAILLKAFAGQLVPQDPSDEPATMLLERIRIERESAARNRPKKMHRSRPGQYALC